MMKQLNKIVYVCAIALSVLFAVGTPAFAAAPGTTCSTAIPLGDDFSENITGPKSVWYTAWTFDLPLTVYFVPQNETDPAPDVEMDFSCLSGFYTDSILCSLFCKTAGSSGIDMNMPHKAALQSKRLDDGTFVYYLSLGKKYRDLLLQMGISYNLEVFVHVTYKGAGTISIAPDDMFTNCMDGPKFIHLGDTVKVKPLDKNRHVIVPYIQWSDDSIRYVWDGTAPVQVVVSAACDFDPDPSAMDERILQSKPLDKKDTLKVTSDKMKYYLDGNQVPSEAGMFFAKFYTEGTGVMKIERVPQAPPRGGATLLRYDKQTPIPVTTPEQMASPVTEPAKLFAIPYTWTTATLFTTPTDHVFRMYIGTDPNFTAETAIATYQFNRTDTCHWLGLKDEEMQALWTNTREQYLYVRFECTAKTTLTPTKWRPSDCVDKSVLITKNSTFAVNSRSTTVYRIFYADWKDGDMSVYWDQTNMCKMLVLKNCDVTTTNGNNSSIVYYEELEDRDTYLITVAELADEWTAGLDKDGYIYVRFYTTNSLGGKITISTNAPEEEDPAPIVYPSATIAVVCDGNPTSAGQQYNVLVSKDQVLSLYSGDITDIAGVTPMDTWSQTVGESHALTLNSGVYVLRGQDDELLRIVVE